MASADVARSKNSCLINTIWGFSRPLTLDWFYSVLGAEYCHTYFWIAKDLVWMQSMHHVSLGFSLSALAWSLITLYNAVKTVNWHEMWNFVALFLWLAANVWWMIGEAHDFNHPDEPPQKIEHMNSAGVMLQVALVWSFFYYLIIIPFNLLPCTKEALKVYDDHRLKTRSWVAPYLTFRQYEALHKLLWIAKDLAWNHENLPFWLLCLVPTLLIGVDCMIIAFTTPSNFYTLDSVHFLVTLMWVIGNSLWAFGDAFVDDVYEGPVKLWVRAEFSWKSSGWHGSWLLLSALVPAGIMYVVWFWLTIKGKLPPGGSRATTQLNSRDGPIVYGTNTTSQQIK